MKDNDPRDALWTGLKERFLILAREAGPAAESLRTVLEPLGKVEEAGGSPWKWKKLGSVLGNKRSRSL